MVPMIQMTAKQKDLLGETMVEKRKYFGKTQEDCAKECEVSVNTWRSWERGCTSPTAENVKKICELLNICGREYDEIFHRD